jgi:hypothetical protein
LPATNADTPARATIFLVKPDILSFSLLMFRAKGRFVPGAASNGTPFGLMAKFLYQS